jgi:phosphatidylserine synthase
MNTNSDPGSNFTKLFGISIFKPIVTRIAPAFHKIGLTPNMVTTIRLILGLISIFLIIILMKFSKNGISGLSILIAFAIFILLFLFYMLDDLDGYLARKYNQISTFGKYYDGSVDIGLIILLLIVFTNKISPRFRLPFLIICTAIITAKIIYNSPPPMKKWIQTLFDFKLSFCLFIIFILLTSLGQKNSIMCKYTCPQNS